MVIMSIGSQSWIVDVPQRAEHHQPHGFIPVDPFREAEFEVGTNRHAVGSDRMVVEGVEFGSLLGSIGKAFKSLLDGLSDILHSTFGSIILDCASFIPVVGQIVGTSVAAVDVLTAIANGDTSAATYLKAIADGASAGSPKAMQLLGDVHGVLYAAENLRGPQDDPAAEAKRQQDMQDLVESMVSAGLWRSMTPSLRGLLDPYYSAWEETKGGTASAESSDVVADKTIVEGHLGRAKTTIDFISDRSGPQRSEGTERAMWQQPLPITGPSRIGGMSASYTPTASPSYASVASLRSPIHIATVAHDPIAGTFADELRAIIARCGAKV